MKTATFLKLVVKYNVLICNDASVNVAKTFGKRSWKKAYLKHIRACKGVPGLELEELQAASPPSHSYVLKLYE